MKQLLFYTLALLSPTFFAQLNMTEIGYLDLVSMHSSEASDIWGYVDQSGNEYAIVGLNDGTSVVDISDPANPVEVFYEPGMNSIWRDIKTWGDYAYVTTEAANGLLIIDLSTLPGNTNLTTSYYTGPTGNEWQSAHNLYIDENGYCYIFGANRGEGGTIILDVDTDPMNPVEVGEEDTYYTHDGVVRGDTLYQAHINDGFFTLTDVSNKANPIYLGQQTTPGVFAHNIWFSDDGNYVYTTDEITNGFIGEFDISDPGNIIETDRIQSSPGQNVIPHNAHFIDNYIVTSYYRDGLVVHDVSNKGNMVEVANFDTSPQYSGDGFNGCWGAYPWLPSGNIITSDIENGLHVLGITYQRGCYLEGIVTDASTTGDPISGVDIIIMGETITDLTDAVGEYETGIANAGSYDIIYSHPAYYDDTIFGVTMSNGVITTQNAQLNPIITADVTIEVTDELSASLDNAIVQLTNADFEFNGTSTSGSITFTNVIPGTYNLTVGKWGYITYCGPLEISGTTMSETIELNLGYYDDFSLDFGWTVSGGAPDGVWERADPNGTSSQGNLINPEDDVTGDCGEMAYVTGNSATGSVGADDVDIADAILTSPAMDLSGTWAPVVSFDIWWVNAGGSGTPNDSVRIYYSDGSQKELHQVLTVANSSSSWQNMTIGLPGFSDWSEVYFIIETADWETQGGHLVEVGIDNLQVLDYGSVNELSKSSVNVFPNPSNGDFTINTNGKKGTYRLFDISGKLIEQGILNNQQILQVKNAGVYILATEIDGHTEMTRLIKQ